MACPPPPSQITRSLANLFPDKLQDSGLPTGWKVTTISEYMEVLDNKRIPLSAREREKRIGIFPYYGATSIMDYVDNFLFDDILLLVGEDGSVKKPNGKPFTQYIWGKVWVNNHAHVLKGKGISTEQLKIFFDQINVAPFITGAVQPKLNQKNLKSIPFTKGTPELHKEFDILINPLFARIRQAANENKNLKAIRDLLIPKLITGEVRLDNMEHVI